MKSKGGVARFLKNERTSATFLLPVPFLSLLLAQLHQLNFFNNSLAVIGQRMTIREWVSAGPLVIFFYVAGLELRRELASGGKKRAALLPPVGAALLGMALPALLYFFGAHIFGANPAAWGVPMATDLPFALAVLTLIGGRGFVGLRIFILVLAIADDVGSIAVVALKFHRHFAVLPFLFALISIGLAWSAQRLNRFGAIAIIPALIGWGFFLASGIHPTVYGVMLGVATAKKRINRALRFWEPISSFVAIPLFLFSALAIELNWPANTQLGKLITLLVIARLLGKPLGIALGARIVAKLFKVELQLSKSALWLAGGLGTLGFSVSLLFAELSLTGADQQAAIIAIFLTLPLALLGLGSYYFFTRATAA